MLKIIQTSAVHLQSCTYWHQKRKVGRWNVIPQHSTSLKYHLLEVHTTCAPTAYRMSILCTSSVSSHIFFYKFHINRPYSTSAFSTLIVYLTKLLTLMKLCQNNKAHITAYMTACLYLYFHSQHLGSLSNNQFTVQLVSL
jgi:hypothetical protein